MRRKFVQIAALSLALALLTGGVAAVSSGGAAQTAAVSGVSDTVIRVGLAYGSNALDGANLANDTGSGFRFGYYDSGNQFVELGSTEEGSVSVVKTTNVGYGTSGGYKSYHEGLAASAKVVVGCWHVQLPGSYDTFEEAAALAEAFEGGFPAWAGGTFYVRVGNYTTEEAAAARQSELMIEDTTVLSASKYGVSAVVSGTNTILFQYDDEGKGTGLGVEPNAVDDGKSYVTYFNTSSWLSSSNNQWYGGFRYERISGGDLTVVNMVGLEDYVKGVVGSEMPNTWSLEALKAQAVCARTYALANHNHTGYHVDVCTTTHCQVYKGLLNANSNTDKAVDQTAGVAVTYNGKYASTNFYSSNGGASMDSALVWGGSYPYLVGKADPYEATISIPSYSWTRSFTGAELSSKLGFSGAVVSARVTSYTADGNPKEILFTTQNNREYSVSTATLVKALSLRSYRYDFGENGGTYDGSELSSGFSINGISGAADDLNGLYAIGGNGNKAQLGGSAYVITGDGQTVPAEQIAGNGGSWTAGQLYTGDNGTFTISGRGFGHNVGLSQYGAYAMAKLGYTYDEILKFYYTGITVGKA